jgi:hypothetical protein
VYGLDFQVTSGTPDAAPARADVVCFIGFVARRARRGQRTPLTPELKRWLAEHGWRADAALVADDDDLLQTPVPLESFEEFARLFAWETRDSTSPLAEHATWLGVAVRSFFAQGGARCLAVRAGDPWPYEAPRSDRTSAENDVAEAARLTRLRALIPNYDAGAMPRADDVWLDDAGPRRRPSWKGIGVLHGLAEAAVVCFPDLPELVANAELAPEGFAEPPPPPEVFVECAEPATPPEIERRWPSPSPACTDIENGGFDTWFKAARAVGLFLEANRGRILADALLALPLPAPGTVRPGRLLQLLAPTQVDPSKPQPRLALEVEDGGAASRTLQVVYPWLTTPHAGLLPGGLEPPDGVFAGVLARSVLARGAHFSLGRQPLRGVTGFKPPLEPEEIAWSGPPLAEDALIDRLSLLGPSAAGPRVLSDVNTSRIEDFRPGGVERLTLAILRAARRLGDELVFDNNGPVLWRRVTRALETLLAGFFDLGAFRGETAADAFRAQCDAATTTQNDLDAGRVVARVSFVPAQPVGWITVVLTLHEGGRVVAAASA